MLSIIPFHKLAFRQFPKQLREIRLGVPIELDIMIRISITQEFIWCSKGDPQTIGIHVISLMEATQNHNNSCVKGGPTTVGIHMIVLTEGPNTIGIQLLFLMEGQQP